MAAVPPEQQSEKAPSRARRTRDTEWEPYRPMIEELYIVQRYSKPVVIEKLREQGVMVTPKQLKRILTKWNLKKKIGAADMEAMLATRRQRGAEGKATQFTYYEHIVDDRKLDRAAKRLKLASTASNVIPTHIRALSPTTSKQHPLVAHSTTPGRLEDTKMDDLLLGSSQQIAPWVDIFHGSPFVTSVQPTSAFHLNDTILGVSPFQNVDDSSGKTGFTQSILREDLAMQDSSSFFASTPNITDVDFVEGSSTILRHDDSDMLGVSPVSPAQAGSNAAGRLALVTALPYPVSESSIASPFSAFLNLDEPSTRLLEPQSPMNHNLYDATPVSRIKFQGRNPVSIIPAVQMIEQLPENFPIDTLQSTLRQLTAFDCNIISYEMLRDTFLAQIDDVAIWAYTAAAEFTRQRRNTRNLGNCSDSSVLPVLYQEDNQTSHVQSRSIVNSTEHSMRARVLAYFHDALTNSPIDGALQIQLCQEAENASTNGIDSLYYISIFAIPKVRARSEAAIRVTFPIKPHNMPMYTTIRTLNVVPEDSEIIKCVMLNDVNGFRTQISENKASPRDVGPDGLSLLTYACVAGGTEILRFLLENGANTNECSGPFGEASLIDFIWNWHVVYTILPVTRARIADADHCKSMVDLAVANGCIIEELEFNPFCPTPMFSITLPLALGVGGVAERQCAEIIQRLLNAGYSKEYRNSQGYTPLLYATFQWHWLSLPVMRALLSKGSDVHAVDDKGQTALHLCLLNSRPLDVCKHSTRPRYEQAISGSINAVKPYDNYNVEEEVYSYEAYSDQESEDGADVYASNASRSSAGSPQCYCIYEDDTKSEKDLICCYCEVRDIDDFKLPHSTSYDNELDCVPEPWMCKARLRLKLFALLQAGCDPNALSKGGLSANDYAAYEGLMAQWEWALAHSGWKYNAELGKCERQDEGTCENGDTRP